jgi:hypothetical protein
MNSLPDWLVERVLLEEVPREARARVEAADATELASRVAALREASTAELASYPAAPAVAEIEARAGRERARHATERRRRYVTLIGVIGTACVLLVAMRLIGRDAGSPGLIPDGPEVTRPKGHARVIAYRNTGERPELLVEDSLVKPGDVLQLRYKSNAAKHGVIASIDGAGEVTLHYPVSEKGSTALAKDTTSLPSAYALDDAPKFERFFIVTSDDPIDVVRTLNTLRTFAQRADSATAEPELPELEQWSLRLRKPEQKAP